MPQLTVYLCDEATGDIVREATKADVALAQTLGPVIAYRRASTDNKRPGFLARVEEWKDRDGDMTRVAIALTDDEIGAL